MAEDTHARVQLVARGNNDSTILIFTQNYDIIYSNHERCFEVSNASIKSAPVRRRKLALLLPAHNEELIIAATIKSAVTAGQALENIYVVDDFSSDRTAIEAHRLLPVANVLSVQHSGKAMAVQKAIKYFGLEKRYVWLHVADADSVFGAHYFNIYKKALDAKKYSVAVGFVQSLRGNWIAKYRAFSYTYGQHIFRRLQAWLGMITVFPGPITTFKTDIIKDLDFASDSPTEDFDLTLQVHRKHLGAIKFIPRAVNYTQDPQTLKDFIKQNQRWQRGFFQGVVKYRIGSRFERIDLSIIYQMMDVLLYMLQLLVVVPLVIAQTHNFMILPTMLALDVGMISLLAIFASVMAKRASMLAALPSFYMLRWVELAVFVSAFVEVVVLHRYREKQVGWDVKGRRYALSAEALKDTAAV